MTSSLVGSEMCIRDRFLVVWIACQTRPDMCWAVTRVPRAIRQSEHAEAVSYTHLTLPTICSV
eukprot:4296078-Prorocentrum_lima.AAC.1